MDIFDEKIAPLIMEKKRQGISFSKMEREMDLPAHSINKWFTGKYKSYKNYYYQLAQYFNKPVSYFYDQEETRPYEGDGQDEYDERLSALLKIMNAEQKKLAIALIEAQLKAQESEKVQ